MSFPVGDSGSYNSSAFDEAGLPLFLFGLPTRTVAGEFDTDPCDPYECWLVIKDEFILTLFNFFLGMSILSPDPAEFWFKVLKMDYPGWAGIFWLGEYFSSSCWLADFFK